MNSDRINLTPPTSVFNKPIKIVDYRKFLKDLINVLVKGLSKDLKGASNSLSDLLNNLKLSYNTGEIAWKLVGNAICKAISALIFDNKHFFSHLNEDEFPQSIENQIMAHDYLYIDSNFFDRPEQSQVVKVTQEYMKKWLDTAKLEKEISESLVNCLSSYFIYALNDEWRNNRSKYESLKEYFNTPFLEADIREDDWRLYSAWLDKQVHENMFDEPFCLKQIYVDLSAYYEVKDITADKPERTGKTSPERVKRIVVDLEQHMEEWLNAGDKDDAIRVISGGPGSGKSSFAKIFCSKQIRKRRVLFVPLHLFDLTGDISESIKIYLRDCQYFRDWVSLYDEEERLLIVFDGLDELTQQGKSCIEIAKQFVDSVDRHISRKNNSKLTTNILLTGRDLSVQLNETFFRKEGQILHLLPYFMSEVEVDLNNYADSQCLLKEDKRDVWWRNYGNFTGKAYDKFPNELRGKNLDELTKYPLLNHLIARSYARGKTKFSSETNINAVYKDLIDAVYERNYSSSGKYKSLLNIDENDFFILLEEIAISAWHGGSERTTTTKEIEEHCKNSGISQLLTQFSNPDKKGVINLLIAFYFRQYDSRSNNEMTFEFTHKSFCEYLIARRIVRQLEMTLNMFEKKYTYEGWSNEDALKKWIALCGKSSLDTYNFEFICNEIKLREKDKIEEWQHMLCELIGYMLQNGLPFECIPRMNFKEECRQSINAETALLAALSACSAVTDEVSDIKWETITSAGTWISKLFRQLGEDRTSWMYKYSELDVSFTRYCLNHINFKDQSMIARDLCCSNLFKTNFSNAYLTEANLHNANLSEAIFTEADLEGANLNGADFHKTVMRGACLRYAILRNANLQEALLQEADLQVADLREANLHGANLRAADLDSVNLCEADLQKACLQEANLREANLQGANLCEAKLKYADLENANLCDANLRGADLTRAILMDTNLSGANIRGVNLHVVDLRNSKVNGIIYDQADNKLFVNKRILKKYGKYTHKNQ